MQSPEDRACIQFALHVCLGLGPEDEIYVLWDCRRILISGQIESIDPSGSPMDALTVALAQTMKLHLGGIQFGELRRDLMAAGMGEEAANRVHDHLVDVSVEEWDRLQERITWYRDDNGDPIMASTKASGTT